MPKLKIPFILRNSLKTDSAIESVILDFSKGAKRPKMISLQDNGHAFIWKQNSMKKGLLEPSIYLMPSLTRSFGKITHA
jgi:hypothetical protein